MRISLDQSFLKKHSALVILVFISFSASAQDTVFLKQFMTKDADTAIVMRYWGAYLKAENRYNCSSDHSKNLNSVQAVNFISFDSFLRPALSNVFIGSNDLTKNTTAASFTQDDKAGTLNLNFARLINQRVLNIGAFSKATEGIFGIYTGNSWSTDVGLTLGISFPIRLQIPFTKKSIRPGLLFDKDDCLELKGRRRSKMIPLFKQIEELTRYDTAALRKKKDELEISLDKLAEKPMSPENYTKDLTHLQLIDSVLKLHYSLIERLNNEIKDVQNKFTRRASKKSNLKSDEEVQTWVRQRVDAATGDYLKERVDSTVSSWEVKNADIFTGYNIIWISFFGAVSNNSITLNTDSLQQKYKADFKSKNLAKVLVGPSINWQRNTKNNLFFVSVGLNYGLRNYLDHPSVRKPGIRIEEATETYYVYNKNETLFARYDELKANIHTIEPSFNFSWFFTAQKQFGFNIRSDIRLPKGLPGAVANIYPATFNFVTGPIFRLVKDRSVSQGTVGLDVGFVDAPVHSNAWDSFTFKFKIGVPFNALIK